MAVRCEASATDLSTPHREDDMTITPSQQMLASCSGALVTSFIVTPFDVVKNRLQAQEHAVQRACMRSADSSALQDLCACTEGLQGSHSAPSRFNGTLDAFVKIRQDEGMRSLWRGLSPALVMSVPATVIYFSAYDTIRDWYGADRSMAPVIAGGTARLGAATIISPLELLRTKVQARSFTSYRDLVDIVRSAVRSEGIFSLWRGLSPTLLRDVPFSVVYWTGYESLKRRFTPPNQRIPSHVAFLSGGIAGSFAALITTPFDVMKTQQQAQMGEIGGHKPSCPSAVPGPDNNHSLRATAQDIYGRQGWRGFFVGAAPRVLKVAPACAIMIGSYEFFKTYFATRNRLTLAESR